MSNLSMANLLKEAGLTWQPKEGDWFAIPLKGMEDEQFLISEMTIQVEVMNGRQMITFNGASEWAMDYITTSEAVWLPSEAQLRSEIEARLTDHDRLVLEISPSNYVGLLYRGEIKLTFSTNNLSELYMQVLCELLTAL